MKQWMGLGFTAGLLIYAPGAWALPGQTAAAVEAWMRSNSTLSAAVNRGLTAFRQDTPARRFTFQASIFPVAGVISLEAGTVIRTEQLTLFDGIDGVTRNRLEESLRAIYGAAVYTDFQQAQPLYYYPQSEESFHTGSQAAVFQGEVWEGQNYAYWLELTSTPQGVVNSGRITVFLKEDLPRLRRQLTGQIPESDR